MRKIIDATAVAMLGLSFHLLGCAGGVVDDGASSSGSGGGSTTATTSTGDGGGGGAACVDEVCDGVDNNCDGVIDEGCECLAGDTQSCYSGPAGTSGVGTCKDGQQACNPTTNKFGPCTGETLPASAELCNGQDDDCDGEVDEDIADIVCGVGGCQVTTAGCVAGQVGVCTPGSPTQEVCDGVDNDCDQLTDEDFPENGVVCSSGTPGVCSPGTTQCQVGALVCVADLQPTGEVCDGLDNDCNGMVDDAIPGTGGMCSTGYPGVCGPGTISCQGGVIDCFSIVPAGPELCDGLDNDCDGVADQGNPEGGGACATGQLGACAQGTVNCIGGALACTPDALALTEVCDGIDNNCDGQVDEGNPGAGQACSCGGATVCSSGQFFCQGCTKEVTCNDGLDDEGDGAIDCVDSECALGCNVNVAPCAAGEKLLVLTSTDVPKAIPDPGTISSTIVVSETGTIKRVVIQLTVTHTFDADLDITLKSPLNSPVIDVTSDNGSSNDNYTATIFNDACATSVVSGAAPFTGCYKPEAPFSSLIGQSPTGTWTLGVTDDAGIDVGTLNSWRLALCVGP